MGPLTVLLLANSWARSLFRFFRGLGPVGLLLLGALDSSFLFLPFGNDLLLIALVSSNRNSWYWLVYVLMSAVGSVIGVFVIDVLMRKAGEDGLKKFLKPNQIERLRKKMEKNAGWAILTATVIPPPFPFTPVVMAAAALQCSKKLLLITIFVGRLVRFSLEALLALYFGRQILRILDSPVVDYIVYGLVVIAIVGSALSMKKWLRRNGPKDAPLASPATSE
jgi:membrane protein YqaA with SNARE-associated domain